MNMWLKFAAAALASSTLTAGASYKSEQPSRYILIPYQAKKILAGKSLSKALYVGEDDAVVRVKDKDVEALATTVHETLGGCGGFIDVTDEIESGLTAEFLVHRELFAAKVGSRFEKADIFYKESVAELIASGNAERMWSDLVRFASFPDRSAISANGTKAADFIVAEAGRILDGREGVKISRVATRGYPNQPSIVVRLEGENPSLPHVVMGGHFDTFGSNKPGADDDASGSALLMEALRTVATKGFKFQHTVDFIWYAAEERGLVGSKSVVSQYVKDKISVKSALQFDMTGFKGDSYDIYLIQDFTNRNLNETLLQIGKTYLPKVTFGSSKCGYACSDHASWHNAGIPTAFPFETRFSNANSRIHKEMDKISFLTKLHAANFLSLGLGYLGTVAEIVD